MACMDKLVKYNMYIKYIVKYILYIHSKKNIHTANSLIFFLDIFLYYIYFI